MIVSLNFLTDSMHPKAQFTVHQYAGFSSDPKIPHDQTIKLIIKCLKGTSNRGLIVKTNSETGIYFWIVVDFMGRWNQVEVTYPSLVLSITGYIIWYLHRWKSRSFQTFQNKVLTKTKKSDWSNFKNEKINTLRRIF